MTEDPKERAPAPLASSHCGMVGTAPGMRPAPSGRAPAVSQLCSYAWTDASHISLLGNWARLTCTVRFRCTWQRSALARLRRAPRGKRLPVPPTRHCSMTGHTPHAGLCTPGLPPFITEGSQLCILFRLAFPDPSPRQAPVCSLCPCPPCLVVI